MIKIFSLLYLAFNFSGIYDYSVPLIEGGSQSLSSYTNKRLLIITLPVSQDASADSLLYSLDTLATAHNLTHKVIAVPSFEDGFTVAQRSALQTWYRSKLGNHILITDGLYTRKTSAGQQHGLFQWLTKVANNGIFDIDVDGPGYKFFVLSDGKLHALLRPLSKMWGPAVNSALTVEPETE